MFGYVFPIYLISNAIISILIFLFCVNSNVINLYIIYEHEKVYYSSYLDK